MSVTSALWEFLEALAAVASEDERSLYDGSDMCGDLNFRTNRMDCGQDSGGLYEDDL